MNIIWDLDGTLTYTLDDLRLAVNYALERHHLPLRSLEQIRESVGNGVRRLMVLSVPDGEANPLFEDCMQDFLAYYPLHCRDHVRLYDGVAECLMALRDAGHRMAIVSNKLQSGVDELFQAFFRDTILLAVGERPGMARKPAPDMVHLAMRELGATAEDTVYIGDSEVDLLTARHAGLPCISVLWGFRSRAFLQAEGATLFAEHPSDILPILDRLTIHRHLLQRGETLATAESCTSGRVAATLTTLSGASGYFQGGLVAYQDRLKTAFLGVEEETITEHDVVSQPVVEQMVKGACRLFSTTYALASTGYADQGSERVPGGTIWLAWGRADDVHSRVLHLSKTREENTDTAVRVLLHEFSKYLLS